MRIAALLSCGELCKSCGLVCGHDYQNGVSQIECPLCNGNGCNECNDGFFMLDKCPREYIGDEFTMAVNLATQSGQGDWPVVGGLLDQSSWFMSLKQHLDYDISRVTAKDD